MHHKEIRCHLKPTPMLRKPHNISIISDEVGLNTLMWKHNSKGTMWQSSCSKAAFFLIWPAGGKMQRPPLDWKKYESNTTFLLAHLYFGHLWLLPCQLSKVCLQNCHRQTQGLCFWGQFYNSVFNVKCWITEIFPPQPNVTWQLEFFWVEFVEMDHLFSCEYGLWSN